ncbi:MAG: DoxX family protein [Gemmatirosa sp.]
MSATILASVPTAARAGDRSTADAAPISRRARLAGRILTGLAVVFLTFDATIKFFATPEALAGTTELGWQPHHLPIIGTLAAICLLLYVVPRTAVLGAVLWTGYLGGAIATHVRVDNPLLSHVLFPVYVAAFVWGGLYLRDARVRALLHPAR